MFGRKYKELNKEVASIKEQLNTLGKYVRENAECPYIGEVFPGKCYGYYPSTFWFKFKECDILDRIDGYTKISLDVGYSSKNQEWIPNTRILYYLDIYKERKASIEKLVKTKSG